MHWVSLHGPTPHGAHHRDLKIAYTSRGTNASRPSKSHTRPARVLKRMKIEDSIHTDAAFDVPKGIWSLVLEFEGGRNAHYERWQSVMKELRKATFILRVNEMKLYARCIRRAKLSAAMLNACSTRCAHCTRRFKRYPTMNRIEKTKALRAYLFRCSEWRCVQACATEDDVRKRGALLLNLQKKYFRGSSLNGWRAH
jgi:hypothetical protein